MPEVPTTEALAELLFYVGRALEAAVNVGQPAPAVAALAERMHNPRPGDLVMEVTSFGPFDPDSIGRLLRVETSPTDHTFVTRWVTEPLGRPGQEQGWQNAEFVALPDMRSSVRWSEMDLLPKEAGR